MVEFRQMFQILLCPLICILGRIVNGALHRVGAGQTFHRWTSDLGTRRFMLVMDLMQNI